VDQTLEFVEKSSANKMHSDQSFNVLQPRGGVGYQKEEGASQQRSSI